MMPPASPLLPSGFMGGNACGVDELSLNLLGEPEDQREAQPLEAC